VRYAFAAKIQIAEVVLRSGFATVRRATIPVRSFRAILGDSQSVIVEIAKIHLRGRVAGSRPKAGWRWMILWQGLRFLAGGIAAGLAASLVGYGSKRGQCWLMLQKNPETESVRN
jgi:hypothetical protein